MGPPGSHPSAALERGGRQSVTKGFFINKNSSSSIGFWTAVALVISNMVGTGVFTSLGFQLQAVPSAFCALSLWALGGVLAACGALTYAELASAMPRSGGEYTYLGETFHPSLGFLSGWVSGTVAFTAPMALSAMAFGRYMGGVFPSFSPHLLGLAALLGVSAAHLWSGDKGARFLNLWTAVKVLPILAILFFGLFLAPSAGASFLPVRADGARLASPGFAVSLVFVSYAYSGWNASTYLAAEVHQPERNVPRSILLGTALVTGLYLLLNAAFLRVAPLSELAGTLEVGNVAGEKIWGSAGRAMVGGAVGLGLVASLSSFVMAGSHLVKTIGQDFPRARFLSRVNTRGNPWVAIVSQTAIALLLFLTSSFERVMTYVGFTLAVFTVLAVLAVFRRRARGGVVSGYRTWGYPWTPILFLAFNFWMMIFILKGHPWESLAGLGTLAAGFAVYVLLTAKAPSPEISSPSTIERTFNA